MSVCHSSLKLDWLMRWQQTVLPAPASNWSVISQRRKKISARQALLTVLASQAWTDRQQVSGMWLFQLFFFFFFCPQEITQEADGRVVTLQWKCWALNFLFSLTPSDTHTLLNQRSLTVSVFFRNTHEVKQNLSLPPELLSAISTYSSCLHVSAGNRLFAGFTYGVHSCPTDCLPWLKSDGKAVLSFLGLPFEAGCQKRVKPSC